MAPRQDSVRHPFAHAPETDKTDLHAKLRENRTCSCRR
jgi:hypothetical protein